MVFFICSMFQEITEVKIMSGKENEEVWVRLSDGKMAKVPFNTFQSPQSVPRDNPRATWAPQRKRAQPKNLFGGLVEGGEPMPDFPAEAGLVASPGPGLIAVFSPIGQMGSPPPVRRTQLGELDQQIENLIPADEDDLFLEW